jgi:uncharacterized membrane protein YfcA
MPCVPYLMALRLDRDIFIQATNCSFTLSSVIMAVGLTRLELFNGDTVILSSIGTIFVFLGLLVGARIRHHLPPDLFRLVVLVMLMAMGTSLVIRAI